LLQREREGFLTPTRRRAGQMRLAGSRAVAAPDLSASLRAMARVSLKRAAKGLTRHEAAFFFSLMSQWHAARST